MGQPWAYQKKKTIGKGQCPMGLSWSFCPIHPSNVPMGQSCPRSKEDHGQGTVYHGMGLIMLLMSHTPKKQAHGPAPGHIIRRRWARDSVPWVWVCHSYDVPFTQAMFPWGSAATGLRKTMGNG